MPGSVLSIYKYYFNPSYEVNITVILILQMWKLRNGIIAYFAQGYKGRVAFNPVLLTMTLRGRLQNNILLWLGKSRPTVNNRDFFFLKTIQLF